MLPSIVANIGCRWVDCGLALFHCPYMIKDAISEIFDALLMLILGPSNIVAPCIFAQKGDQ